MIESLTRKIVNDIYTDGFSHIRRPLSQSQYRQLAEQLGKIVNEEKIALRLGAHAYVAKPGRVPQHTDHPKVDVIGWYCEQQDGSDGASCLLDARRIIADLSVSQLESLYQIKLRCPPLAGGPPRELFPVLRQTAQGAAVFCPPWIEPVGISPAEKKVLDEFIGRVSKEAKRNLLKVRLSPNEALFVDNTSILHGRDPISDTSQRCLHRLWIIRHPKN